MHGPVGAGQDTGLIFVPLERGNEVVVLNPDLTENTRIETSRRPRDMPVNRDRALLFVACGDDDSIDVIDEIDVEALQVVDSIPTGPSPEVFAFSPDET